MKTLVEQLQEHWDNTSEEQLQAEWKEIEALGLEGPNALEYARLIQLHNPILLSWTENPFIKTEEVTNFQNIAKISQGFNGKPKNDIAGNYKYAMAA